MEFQVGYLVLFHLSAVIDGFAWFWMGIFPKEYQRNTGSSQGSILGPARFLLYINDLADDVIWNIAVYAVDTTLYS